MHFPFTTFSSLYTFANTLSSSQTTPYLYTSTTPHTLPTSSNPSGLKNQQSLPRPSTCPLLTMPHTSPLSSTLYPPLGNTFIVFGILFAWQKTYPFCFTNQIKLEIIHTCIQLPTDTPLHSTPDHH